MFRLEKKEDALFIRIDMEAGRPLRYVICRDPAGHQSLEKIRLVVFFFIGCAQTADLRKSLFSFLRGSCRHIHCDPRNAFQFRKRFCKFLCMIHLILHKFFKTRSQAFPYLMKRTALII